MERVSANSASDALLIAPMTRTDFENQQWLSVMEIARKHGYTTPTTIENAIARGELPAYRTPCGRRKQVKTQDYGRWIEFLRYEPPVPSPAVAASAKSKVIRRGQMPIPR